MEMVSIVFVKDESVIKEFEEIVDMRCRKR